MLGYDLVVFDKTPTDNRPECQLALPTQGCHMSRFFQNGWSAKMVPAFLSRRWYDYHRPVVLLAAT